MKQNDLVRVVAQTISRHNMLAAGDKVLVAVSGGPDSVALLSVLSELAPELAVTLHVFHLDHGLRAGSVADAEFVREHAGALGVPATIIRADVGSYCSEHNLGVETGAREVRYRLMEQVAREVGATRVATGHTLDDQVETFLMRLVRGAGATGLRAIPPVRGVFIRPLIDVTRAQVLKWCAARNLTYRLDETNDVPDQLRNILRLEVVPTLRTANPNLAETVSRAIEILADEDEYMSRLAAEDFSKMARAEHDRVVIDLATLRQLPTPLARRILRRAAASLGVDESSIGTGQIEEVLRQLHAGGDVEVHLTGDLRAFVSYEALIIAASASPQPRITVELDVPGRTEVPQLDVVVETRLMPRAALAEIPSGPWRVAVDADAIGGELVVSNAHPGDRFSPLGMGGTKKLSDFLVDGKVPKRTRAKVPIVRCNGHIVWVVGHRIDERFKIGEATRRVLLLDATRR